MQNSCFLEAAGLLLFWGAVLCAAIAHAASVEGVWRTMDDSTGKPKALVRLADRAGVVSGSVVKIFNPDPEWDGRCSRCTDHRRNQPVLGMVILSNARKEGNEYTGGEILDPENGNVYRCVLRLTEDRDKLEVRGYIGIPLFGRTQVWVREK